MTGEESRTMGDVLNLCPLTGRLLPELTQCDWFDVWDETVGNNRRGRRTRRAKVCLLYHRQSNRTWWQTDEISEFCMEKASAVGDRAGNYSLTGAALDSESHLLLMDYAFELVCARSRPMDEGSAFFLPLMVAGWMVNHHQKVVSGRE